MALSSAVRRKIIEVARRLIALREESVAPSNAVNLLVVEGILPTHEEPNSERAWSSAIRSVIPDSAASIADYVRTGEQQQRSDETIGFLSRLDAEPRKWNDALALIVAEFLVLLVVVTLFSVIVVPQFRETYEAVGASLPLFTQMVFGVLSPSLPFLWGGIFIAIIGLVWRFLPRLLGPLIGPLDKLILAIPGFGSSVRRRNADMISGWLGFGSPDASGQQNALDAARAWYSNGLLSRICATVLAQVACGREILACLAESQGFDREFRVLLLIPDRSEAQAALRVRWLLEAERPRKPDKIIVLLIHIWLGIIVAAIVIAMYLPIFKFAALLG